MHPLTNPQSLDPLIESIGERKLVLLGEASHGTHEYYTWRTAISKRLIEEQGFNFIVVEGDWPACYQLNRYIKGYKQAGTTVESILQKMDRWPTWMWANWEVADLIEWMKKYNKKLSSEKKIGFYGLDVYSLWTSMNEMLIYLEKEDHPVAEAVRKAVACFDPFDEDEQKYARHTRYNERCKKEVVNVLQKIRRDLPSLDGDREAAFNAEQNALIAVNAEEYYSAMIQFDGKSWNVRDRHMMETVKRLMDFHGENAKGIVWAHNTHIGDASATDMADEGLINVGQLARQEYGRENVYLCGFAGYEGEVIAGSAWEAPMEKMTVPKAKRDSIEDILHHHYNRDGYLLFEGENKEKFNLEFPHRAIGVVYDPRHERRGNYVPSIISERYDALLYLNTTTALHPLYIYPDKKKLPDTFPSSF